MSIEFFNRATKAHQSGDLHSAEQLYIKFLQYSPKDPNALQLLGVVCHAKGDFESALMHMKASLKVKSNQPHVLLNLAMCQRQSRQHNEALKTFNKLLKQVPDHAVAFKNKIQLLSEMGRNEQALTELRHKIDTSSGNFELFSLLGEISSNCKLYPDAISAYNKAIDLKPVSAVALHNLGLAYRLNAEPEKALTAYHKALDVGKPVYQLMHNLGNAYSDLGQLEKAIEYYQKALKLNFGYIETHINLNDLLWETGNTTHYLQSYIQAIFTFPDDPVFVYQYVRRLFRISQYELALKVLDSKKAMFGMQAEYQYLYAKVQISLGHNNAGKELLMDVQGKDSLSLEDQLDICEILLKQKSYDLAQSKIEQILKIEPHNIAALAYWGICLRHTGNNQEQELNDYAHFVQEYVVFDPVKEVDFYDELVVTLSELHSSKEQPIDQTLINGTQTRGRLFSYDKPVIKELVQRIRSCVAMYIEQNQKWANEWCQLPDAQNPTFIGSWSVKLKSGGFHSNHFHPMGKLSSVLYISLPDSIADTTENEGFLKFGEPNFRDDHNFPPNKFIKPEVGKLVLFPSYFWHGTVPFSDESYRLTVAFDIT